ncbi:MAG: leucine-rich repeat protein [Promethearchaeota archaeon]
MDSGIEKKSKEEILKYLFELITDSDETFLKELIPQIEGRPEDFFEPLFAALKPPERTKFRRGSASEDDMFHERIYEFLDDVWPERLAEKGYSREEGFVSIPVVFAEDWNTDAGMYTVPESSPFYVSERVKVIDLTPRTEYWETRGSAAMLALEEIDLSSLRKCSQLHTLILSKNALYSIDLSPLRFCKRLRVLKLNGNLLSNIDLNPLENCKNLVEVDLSATDESLHSVDVSSLFRCTELQKLKIDEDVMVFADPVLKKKKSIPLGIKKIWNKVLWAESDISIEDLQTLQEKRTHEKMLAKEKRKKTFPNEIHYTRRASMHDPQKIDEIYEVHIGLKELLLTKKFIVEIDLTPLRNCKNLEILDLAGNEIRFVDLTPLQHCFNLRVLRIDGLSRIDLTPLKELAKLEVLRITGYMNQIDLSPIEHCQRLSEINLGYYLKHIEFNVLKKATNLRTLHIRGKELHQVDLSYLENCYNLEVLSISGRIEQIEFPIFVAQSQLKLLVLSTNHLTEINLDFLQKCPNFERILINRNRITHIDLEPFKSCPKLEKIDLSQNKLMKLDLTPLRHCKNLIDLDLGYNPLRELDISPLFECPKLERINTFGFRVPIVANSELREKKDVPRALKWCKDSKTIQWR